MKLLLLFESNVIWWSVIVIYIPFAGSDTKCYTDTDSSGKITEKEYPMCYGYYFYRKRKPTEAYGKATIYLTGFKFHFADHNQKLNKRASVFCEIFEYNADLMTGDTEDREKAIWDLDQGVATCFCNTSILCATQKATFRDYLNKAGPRERFVFRRFVEELDNAKAAKVYAAWVATSSTSPPPTTTVITTSAGITTVVAISGATTPPLGPATITTEGKYQNRTATIREVKADKDVSFSSKHIPETGGFPLLIPLLLGAIIGLLLVLGIIAAVLFVWITRKKRLKHSSKKKSGKGKKNSGKGKKESKDGSKTKNKKQDDDKKPPKKSAEKTGKGKDDRKPAGKAASKMGNVPPKSAMGKPPKSTMGIPTSKMGNVPPKSGMGKPPKSAMGKATSKMGNVPPKPAMGKPPKSAMGKATSKMGNVPPKSAMGKPPKSAMGKATSKMGNVQPKSTMGKATRKK
uniref:Uncharacterized protein n=1 Tax=Haemonchus contortus TaxID=6289 RepID=A0A7I4YYF5_HAECO